MSNDLRDGRFETLVEHAIRFVEHKVAYVYDGKREREEGGKFEYEREE